MDSLFDYAEKPTTCLHCGRALAAGICSWCNPAKPYRTADGERTIGWSGTDTSRERARKTDASYKQDLAIRMLAEARDYGVTVVDLRDVPGIGHHGTASGTLSNLHKAGKIARLHESRDRCKVYVLPEFTNGRQTEPYGRNPSVRTSDSPVHIPTDAGAPGTLHQRDYYADRQRLNGERS